MVAALGVRSRRHDTQIARLKEVGRGEEHVVSEKRSHQHGVGHVVHSVRLEFFEHCWTKLATGEQAGCAVLARDRHALQQGLDVGKAGREDTERLVARHPAMLGRERKVPIWERVSCRGWECLCELHVPGTVDVQVVGTVDARREAARARWEMGSTRRRLAMLLVKENGQKPHKV